MCYLKIGYKIIRPEPDFERFRHFICSCFAPWWVRDTNSWKCISSRGRIPAVPREGASLKRLRTFFAGARTGGMESSSLINRTRTIGYFLLWQVSLSLLLRRHLFLLSAWCYRWPLSSSCHGSTQKPRLFGDLKESKHSMLTRSLVTSPLVYWFWLIDTWVICFLTFQYQKTFVVLFPHPRWGHGWEIKLPVSYLPQILTCLFTQKSPKQEHISFTKPVTYIFMVDAIFKKQISKKLIFN